MGVLERIRGSCLSCFGLSTRRRNTYPDHDIPKVFEQSVSNYPTRSSRSSSSQRYSSGATRPSSSYYSQTARKSTQPREERLIFTGSSSSIECTSTRTGQTSSGSEVATNISAVPVNIIRIKSRNTGPSKVTQFAIIHHAKQQHQARQVKPPQTQPVKLSQAESVKPPQTQLSKSSAKSVRPPQTQSSKSSPKSVRPPETQHVKSSSVKPPQTQSVQSSPAESVRPPQTRSFKSSSVKPPQTQSVQSSPAESVRPPQTRSFKSSSVKPPQTQPGQSSPAQSVKPPQTQSFKSSSVKPPQTQPGQSSPAESVKPPQTQSFKSSSVKPPQTQSFKSSSVKPPQTQPGQSSPAAESVKPPQTQSFKSSSVKPPQTQPGQSSPAESVKPPQTQSFKSSSVKPPQTQPGQSSPAESVRPPQTPLKIYLRNFTCQLKTTSKDKTFKPIKGDIIYQNQWTACSAVIIDQFGKQLSNSTHTIGLSSNSHVEFWDYKAKAGRLHFNMKCSETGNISISIKIDQFKFIKEFYVTCSPCSSSLCEIVVTKMDSLEDECVYRLAIVDVFGEPILADSPEIYVLETASPCENKIVQKLMYSKNGKKYFDIIVRGERPWSKDLVLLLNGKQIPPVTKFEVSHKESEEIASFLEKHKNVLLERDQVPVDDIVDCLGSRMFISFLTGDDDGEFVPYNENNCQIQRLPDQNGYQLVCQNAKKYDILGADSAHVNNIKRVLQLKDRVEINESADQTNVIIDFRNVQSHRHPIGKEVVQHLLRGLYYRRKAAEVAKVRMKWKKRFTSLDRVLRLSLRNSPSLRLCKGFKDFFGGLMNKYNRDACDELFMFFNFQRDKSEVDLHGLLVADEERLELLRLEMLRGSLSNEEIEALFGQCKMKSFKGRKKQALKKKLLKGEMPDDKIEDFIELCRDDIHDEFRLDAFERELLQRQRHSKHVDGIIKQWRSESDEAIRKLEKTLENFDLEEAIK
ncbi:Hypothetical predicted protein, partial [Paramuricea clavata]